jgi:nucleoside-diphosphate-sugar epimerase
MRVFLAGGAGAIGRPLVERLVAGGHEVTATTRTAERAERLRAKGAEAVVLDAFDHLAVRNAVVAARPEVLVHQLTALPRDPGPRAMKRAVFETARLRRETVPTFVASAREAGARRVIVQSLAFVAPPGDPAVLDEDAPIWLDGPPEARETFGAVRDMEEATLGGGVLGIVLRYGFFYGPGTWYAKDGAIGRMVKKRMLPCIGDGRGLWSFVHVDDAAEATVLALERGEPGVYNVCDDEPVPQNVWLPEMARLLGAKPPLRVPAFLARPMAGPLFVHYATTLHGAANRRAKAALGWRPRGWRDGFQQVFGGISKGWRGAPASSASGDPPSTNRPS